MVNLICSECCLDISGAFDSGRVDSTREEDGCLGDSDNVCGSRAATLTGLLVSDLPDCGSFVKPKTYQDNKPNESFQTNDIQIQ